MAVIITKILIGGILKSINAHELKKLINEKSNFTLLDVREDSEVKIAVLEQRLEDLRPIVLRIDAAIEKLSEVNISVSKMLAVHEQRISKQEEIDTVLFTKIDKLRDKMDSDHDIVLQRIRQLEKRVWMALGGMAVLSFGIRVFTVLPKLLTNINEVPRIEKSYTE